MKGVIHRLDSHLRMSCSTVFLDIPESFLDDAKQAQRNVRRHGARHVLMGEYNLDSSLSGEFLAECRPLLQPGQASQVSKNAAGAKGYADRHQARWRSSQAHAVADLLPLGTRETISAAVSSPSDSIASL